MFKIFNQFRKTSIKDRRISKYLLYALGEIVLVVIGIFIALQLNAWKADLKDRKLEQGHLCNIKEDLQLQLEIIEAQMLHDSILTLRADSAYSYFNGDITLIELENLLYGAFNLGYRKTFVVSDASFNELLNTGGMNLISDLNLRKSFMRYHQQLSYTSKVINTNNGLIDEIFNLHASSNAVTFSLDANGNIDTTVVMTGKERYRLMQAIKGRQDLCKIALMSCEKQRVATNTLIAKVNDKLTQ